MNTISASLILQTMNVALLPLRWMPCLSCALRHRCMSLRHRLLIIVNHPLRELFALAVILIATGSCRMASLRESDILPVRDILALAGTPLATNSCRIDHYSESIPYQRAIRSFSKDSALRDTHTKWLRYAELMSRQGATCLFSRAAALRSAHTLSGLCLTAICCRGDDRWFSQRQRIPCDVS